MSDLSRGLDWFLDNSSQISTVVDQLSGAIEPRGIIAETPREGYPDGVDAAPVNNVITRAADVVKQGTDFYSQLKGLFGLGYPASTAQPVSPVAHEVSPTEPIPEVSTAPSFLAGMNITTIAIIAIAAFFLVKK